jgi:hypothetical protein
MKEIQDKRSGDLTLPELQLLMQQREKGDFLNCHLVSLGDLGRKDIRHEQGDAGTTLSFQWAKEFFDGFQLNYDLVTGNHDLEGLDEFTTDKDNLQAFLNVFERPSPQFHTYLGEKTLLLGLSTTRFREAPHSSHEVHVDDQQLTWFVNMVEQHPASEGWKIVVVSHAPPMGSGLRVLQSVHVINGCAWLNHCSPSSRRLFLQTCQQNPQIKLWFSGHFHLSHDYQDSISTVGQCTFCQVGVVGPVSSRDGNRQTRLVRGNAKEWQIYTINHHIRDQEDKAQVRLDATMNVVTGQVTLVNGSQDVDREDWFQAYIPREEDGCYLESPDGIVDSDKKVCWWHMADGAVLGLHEGQLVEYDAETLSPLGIVVNQEKLKNRQVLVVEEGTAVVLVNDVDQSDIQVVHPNEDGSYWRKFQRNKKVRQEEKAREAAARLWFEKKR